jgi:predicted metal-dependent hydrolase
MEIKIIRSIRRRRTVSARLVKNTLLISAPRFLSDEHLGKIVSDFKERFSRQRLTEDAEKERDLRERAQRLNKRYFGNALKINSLEYSVRQKKRFGCCHFHDARIRIAHKVSLLPGWVKDYVLLHEMAHLIEPNHSRAFWNIVSRYKFTERARGYLLASRDRDRKREDAA